MDDEGTDVHLMVWNASSYEAADPEIESEFLQANHRCLADVCAEAPERLKSLLVVTPRTIKESIREIETWGGDRWAVGIQPLLPYAASANPEPTPTTPLHGETADRRRRPIRS